MNNSFPITFSIPTNGFEWLMPPFHYGRSPASLELCTKEPALVAKPSKKARTVILPDKLFLEFAELNPSDREEILKFANIGGWLSGDRGRDDDRGQKIIVPSSKGGGGGLDESADQMVGELHSDWNQSIREMKRCTTVWQAIKTQDVQELRKLFHRVDQRHLEYLGTKRIIRGITVYDGGETIDELSENLPLRPDDPIQWATIYLVKTINTNRGNQVAPILRVDPGSGQVVEIIRPLSLGAALWDQLSKAITNGASIRPCDECGKAMIIASGEFRASRRTCSNTCRFKIYETRKEDARRMRQERMPLKDIAVRLDTTIAQIKKWTESPNRIAS
jgi:hypothetical protein